MTRKLFSLVLMAGLSVVASAADKPNFSGSWVLNEGKSTFPEMPMGAPGGGGPGGGGPGGAGGRGRMMGGIGANRTIVHEDPKVITTSKLTGRDGKETEMVSTITTDGKNSTNKSRRGSTKTKGAWEGAKLKFNHETEISGPNGDFTLTSVEEWSLSNDGKQMTVNMKNSTPMGDIDVVLVFDKQ
jgi:hypothetical protein